MSNALIGGICQLCVQSLRAAGWGVMEEIEESLNHLTISNKKFENVVKILSFAKNSESEFLNCLKTQEAQEDGCFEIDKASLRPNRAAIVRSLDLEKSAGFQTFSLQSALAPTRACVQG